MSCLEEERDSAVRHRVELPRDHDAPGAARRHLDARVGAGLGELAYANARLIVSELVTNALAHGEGRIFLGLEMRAGTLRIEVIDEGTGRVPAIRDQPDGVPGGWGLRIVDTVALRWGVFTGSTHVWAEIGVDGD